MDNKQRIVTIPNQPSQESKMTKNRLYRSKYVSAVVIIIIIGMIVYNIHNSKESKTEVIPKNKINIHEQDISPKKAIKIISKQSGYQFIVKQEALKDAHNLSLSLTDADLKAALEALSKEQSFTYHVDVEKKCFYIENKEILTVETNTVMDSAVSRSEKETLITLNEDTADIKELLYQIQNQTLLGINMARGALDGAKKVTVHLKNKPLAYVLEHISKEQPFYLRYDSVKIWGIKK